MTEKPPTVSRHTVGVCCALGANAFWGLCPIYWRQIEGADSTELVCHRIVWSFVLLAILIPVLLRAGWWGGFKSVWQQIADRKVLVLSVIPALMIGTNWLGFIWAVNNGQVLEAALGYYINPLFNVLLGVVVLRERLGKIQWMAVAITAVGVGVIAVASGGVPWVSLMMASSFATYGLIKKQATLPVLVGLFIEVVILFVPAILYLGWRCAEGISSLQTGSGPTTALVLAAGVVTVAPLALFAAGVQRVNLALIGLLQFICPTIQFLVGTFLYAEPMDQTRLLGFAFVWTGLAVFLFVPKLLDQQEVRQVASE